MSWPTEAADKVGVVTPIVPMATPLIFLMCPDSPVYIYHVKTSPNIIVVFEGLHTAKRPLESMTILEKLAFNEVLFEDKSVRFIL